MGGGAVILRGGLARNGHSTAEAMARVAVRMSEAGELVAKPEELISEALHYLSLSAPLS